MNLAALFGDGQRFLGIEWHLWKIIGWTGNLIFFSRFFVQWIATEKEKRVVVPISFWWLSLAGSLMLLSYGLWQRDSVFIFAYAFTWIPYIRSIVIHYRNEASHVDCAACGTAGIPRARFCHHCGAALGNVQEEADPLSARPAPRLALRHVTSQSTS